MGMRLINHQFLPLNALMMKSFHKILLISLIVAFAPACDELKDLFGISEPTKSDINPDIITDSNLRECLAQTATFLNKSEVLSVVCAGKTVETLAGLEQFTNLRVLLVNSNRIRDVDLSAFPELEFVDLSANRLSQIDLSQNPKLTEALLDGNNLSELNISNNPNLEALNLRDNELSSLDLSQNTLLRELTLENNQFVGDMTLGALVLTNNTRLNNLNLFGNDITQIDLSTNVNLDKVDIRQNELNSIDLTTNSNITELRLNDNNLVSIDLRFGDSLRLAQIEDNNLQEVLLPLTKNLRTADLARNEIVCGTLVCNPGDKFQIPRNDTFIRLDLRDNDLTTEALDLSQNLFFTELFLSGNADITGVLDVSSLNEMVELRIDNTGITDLDFGGLIDTAPEVFALFDFQVITAVEAGVDGMGVSQFNPTTKALLDSMEATKSLHPRFPASQLLYIHE